MPNWFGLATAVFGRLPIERWLIKPRDATKSLEELAARLAESQNNAPLSPRTTINTQKATAAPERHDIATACVPCALGHFSTSAGLLNEAVRFKGEGIISNEILDRIAKVLEEQNTLERVDLTSEKLQRAPGWERDLAEEALGQSRGLRHRLETLITIEDLEAVAADTEGYYRNFNRKWWKLRVAKTGKTEPELTLEDAKKMAAEEAESR